MPIDKGATWRLEEKDKVKVQFEVTAGDGTVSTHWFYAFVYAFYWFPGQARLYYPAQLSFPESVEEVLFVRSGCVVHLDRSGEIEVGLTR